MLVFKSLQVMDSSDEEVDVTDISEDEADGEGQDGDMGGAEEGGSEGEDEEDGSEGSGRED